MSTTILSTMTKTGTNKQTKRSSTKLCQIIWKFSCRSQNFAENYLEMCKQIWKCICSDTIPASVQYLVQQLHLNSSLDCIAFKIYTHWTVNTATAYIISQQQWTVFTCPLLTFQTLHPIALVLRSSHLAHVCEIFTLCAPTHRTEKILLHNKIISASSAVCWENCITRSAPLLSQTENTPKDSMSPPFPAPRATSQPILWGHGDKYWHAACETGWVDMYNVV